MHIFGLTFILYLLKWSNGNGFWSSYRDTDNESYKKAIKTQRIFKKLMRCEQAIKFMKQCRDANVFPKFTRWKIVNGKSEKIKSSYRRKVLLDEIRTKNELLRELKAELSNESDELYRNMTFMKKWMVKQSIQNTAMDEKAKVEKRHEKKFSNLLKEKSQIEGTAQNPNRIIWNFSSHPLQNEEYQTLQYGLKHGIARRADEDEILASAEALWDQIKEKKLCKQGNHFMRQAKNSIRAMAFNLINIDDHQIYKDQKKIKIIRNLREKVVLLTPDKGNGVVILDKCDYINSMEQLFEDRTKFRVINEDPTHTRMATLQNYVRMLKNTKQINDEEYKLLYPKNAKIGRAHGSAKVHKEFENIPPLRPIIDTIGSTHYGVGKFLSKLLNPLTQNAYNLKDSFEAADRIKGIPQNLYEEGYRLVSFDVKSLFTSVPLQKTVDIILDRVYNQNVIQTTLKKRTLKKLIIDTCSKTAFSYNKVIYEQIDGVSMGACLGPVLANIIMTELEKVIVDGMIESGKIKFYARYVDDTLLLVKPGDVDDILRRFNSFHSNLEFTVDSFEHCVPHFLDLEIHPDGLSIYRKDTHREVRRITKSTG